MAAKILEIEEFEDLVTLEYYYVHLLTLWFHLKW